MRESFRLNQESLILFLIFSHFVTFEEVSPRIFQCLLIGGKESYFLEILSTKETKITNKIGKKKELEVWK